MLELCGLNLSYRYPESDRDVLAGLTVSARAGRVMWLKGRNGAGKTTLLEVLSGLRTPDEGMVSLGDESVSRDHIAYLPSDPPVFDELDAAEHAALMIELWNLGDARAREYADRFGMLLGLLEVPRSGMRVGKFSDGMKEKLAFAMMLAQCKQALLLDEPFTALDADALAVAQQLLSDYAADHVVMIATHLASVVEPLMPQTTEIVRSE